MPANRRAFTLWFLRSGVAVKVRGHAWRALRHANYRAYFAGQAISILGNWVQQVALGWLVYRLTGSAMLLGVTAFLTQIPQLFVAPVAGIIIDRSNIRRLMILIQFAMFLLAVLLAVITYFGWIQPWHILLVAAFFGILNSFDVPLRHAYTSQLVTDRQDLPNAIALNSLFFNIARFIGPPLAGLILSLTSEALCFALNGVSFLVILAVMMRLQTGVQRHSQASFRDAMQEGVKFIRGSVPVRQLLIQVAVLNFLAANYIPLMPAFAREIFHGGPNMLGTLLGCAGAGALCCSLSLAVRPSVRGLSGAITQGCLLTGLALLAFALSSAAWLGCIMLFLLGFGMVNGNASSNTILQTILPEHLRGRVLAIYSAANLGAAALGSLLSGALAERLGPAQALAVLAAILIFASIHFYSRLEWLRMYLRPIYASQGITRQKPRHQEMK